MGSEIARGLILLFEAVHFLKVNSTYWNAYTVKDAVFPAPECARALRCPPRLLRRETPRERCPGGREDARGAVCYTSQLHIGAWNCGGLSNATMTMCKDIGFDILALSETHKLRSETDAIVSEQPEEKNLIALPTSIRGSCNKVSMLKMR